MALVLRSAQNPRRVTLKEATKNSGVVKKVGNGRVQIKIIEPGQGATGFYTPEVLAATAAAGLFDNVPICKNHPGTGQRTERPDVDLTVAFIEPNTSKYQENGPLGPGVYGIATVLGPYREMLYSFVGTPFGLSIHADGELEREGDVTSRVLRIDKVHSVDLVVKPGAGGAIVGVMESKRLKRNNSPHSYPLIPAENARKEKKMAGKTLYEEYVDQKTGERFVYVGNLNEEEGEELEESEMLESNIIEDDAGNQFMAIPLLEDGSIDEESLQEILGASGIRQAGRFAKQGFKSGSMNQRTKAGMIGARARGAVDRGRSAASSAAERGRSAASSAAERGKAAGSRARDMVRNNPGRAGAAAAGLAAAGAGGAALAARRRKEEEDLYEEEQDGILGLIAEGLQGIREDLNDIKNGPAQREAIQEAANSATRGSNNSRRLVEELAIELASTPAEARFLGMKIGQIIETDRTARREAEASHWSEGNQGGGRQGTAGFWGSDGGNQELRESQQNRTPEDALKEMESVFFN